MQVDFNEQLVQKENEFRQQDREKYEPEFQEYLEGRQSRNYEYLMRERIKKKQPLEDAQEKAYETGRSKECISSKISEQNLFCNDP